MSQINSNTKDDFQVVFLLSCFVGHPVCHSLCIRSINAASLFSIETTVMFHKKKYYTIICLGKVIVQGVPKNMGIQWRIRYRLCYELAIVIPNFKSHNIIMSARVYFMKRVKDCKDVSKCLRKMCSEDWQVYSVCILQFSWFTKSVQPYAVKT